MESKINVYVTLDTTHNTWNVMSLTNECLFYSRNVEGLETWLDDNKDKYFEQGTAA